MYSGQDAVRSIIRNHRPVILWFMTDPRFFCWLWEIEYEIRSQIPMVYYHVWDNFPAPMYNAKFYNSTDVICAISKVTDAIVKKVAPAVESHYCLLSTHDAAADQLCVTSGGRRNIKHNRPNTIFPHTQPKTSSKHHHNTNACVL